MAVEKIYEGLRHVSASTTTLTLIMEGGVAVHLNQDDKVRVLAEIASATPELLHGALEQRLITLIAAKVRDALWPGRSA